MTTMEIQSVIDALARESSFDEVKKLAKNPRKSLTEWSLPGFVPMTRISTSFGEVYAQALRLRDLVRTRSGEYLPVLWLDRVRLDEEYLRTHPEAQPIYFGAGSLGQDLPRMGISLSPGQLIATSQGWSSTLERTASSLLDRPGVFQRPEPAITYTQFHLGKPTIIRSEGLWLVNKPMGR